MPPNGSFNGRVFIALVQKSTNFFFFLRNYKYVCLMKGVSCVKKALKRKSLEWLNAVEFPLISMAIANGAQRIIIIKWN